MTCRPGTRGRRCLRGTACPTSPHPERFDSIDWKLVAWNRLRTRYDFPEREIEIVGGYMGDRSAPHEDTIEFCQVDSMDSDRLLARLVWDWLDPLGAGFRMWNACLLWRSPRLINLYTAQPGSPTSLWHAAITKPGTKLALVGDPGTGAANSDVRSLDWHNLETAKSAIASAG